ncbi:MAG TPA: type II toxin-antitoxin system RelE/ParE family toxin [Polyangia bacterium]|jgi:Plasmid stabilisation system protein.|nr:type II toxin-antitoxin system RelE/ParE family toxin [Polyangia bacterium]
MTVRFRVELSPQARDQLTTINLWWARNRPAAPTLVAVELEAAIQQLATSPESGSLHDGSRPVQVRKLLMPRGRYRLYYEVDPVSRLVTVRRHVAHGAGPRL